MYVALASDKLDLAERYDTNASLGERLGEVCCFYFGRAKARARCWNEELRIGLDDVDSDVAARAAMVFE